MINWNQVHSLKQDVGDEDFDEVLALFFEEVEEAIRRLRQPVETARLADELHFLKGAAMNLGFQSLSDCCRSGEEAVQQGKADSIDPRQFEVIYASAKQCFLAEAPNRI